MKQKREVALNDKAEGVKALKSVEYLNSDIKVLTEVNVTLTIRTDQPSNHEVIKR